MVGFAAAEDLRPPREDVPVLRLGPKRLLFEVRPVFSAAWIATGPR